MTMNLQARIAELVAAAQANIETTEAQAQALKTTVDALREAMRRPSKWESTNMVRLELGYFPDSFNGRKVAFGVSGSGRGTPDEMYRAIVCAGVEERLLDHLTRQVLPRWVAGELSSPEFHF